MYSVTDGFKDQIIRSQQIVTLVEVTSEGEVIYDDLQVHEGNVTVDKQAANRRRCNVKVSDVANLTPKDANDLLHPLSGHELKLYRGVHINKEDRDELVPLGVFQLEDADIDDSGEAVNVNIKGFDRSKKIERQRYIEPYFVAEGENYADAILDLINFVEPGLVYNFMNTTRETPPMIFGTGGWSGGGNPWKDAVKMAESLGAELFFNSEGICVLRPEPDPATDPIVWEYEEGEENTILYIARGLTREEVFNHVIAYGANSSTEPIRVEAVDDDPDSPTYIDGPFGDVPTFYRSTMLLTVDQAQDAADAKLRSVLGTPEQARFNSIVNPAHELGDVITITRDRIGMNESRHVLDKISIPLTTSTPLNAACREKRVQLGS